MTSESTERTVLEAVAERRERINDAIAADLPKGEPERLYDASHSILQAGGKRLRPAMLLLAAEAITDVRPLSEDYREFPTLDDGTIDLMAAAVSVEVIHSFTLIHDDIMDDDDMRRGIPAVHRAYDTSTAILAGDTLYSKAFETILKTGANPEYNLEAVDMLAQTCTHICEGQAMDVEFETRAGVVPDEYLEMIELKTAVLYAAAAAIPAIVLGANRHTIDSLYQYGLCVGQAFQIQDDILDLTTPSEELGKQRGSDLVEEKQTIITLHAREQGVDVDSLVGADDVDAVSEAVIDDALATLENAGSIEYARGVSHDLVSEGKNHVADLPDNSAHRTLESVADYLVERSY